MASKVIEELIIKIKQQGFIKTKKSVEELGQSLEDAAAGGELLNEVLDQTPNYIDQITHSYKEMAKASSQVNAGFDADGIIRELKGLDARLSSVFDEMVGGAAGTEEAFDRLTDEMKQANHELSSLAGTSERTEDKLSDVARASTKAGAGLVSVSKGAKKANQGLGNTHRQGQNTARTFSKMAKAGGSLPIMYAAIAANVFAVSEGFRVLNEAANQLKMEEVGSILGQRVGQPTQVIARNLQEATGYAISFREAMKAASSTISYGFAVDELTEMTKVAQQASIVMGVEMNDALNRITKGIAKQEIELLDELGITVRLNKAFADYGRQHGLAADSLSDFQRQQAMVNAVLKQGEERFKGVDPSELVSGWERLGVAINDSTQTMLKSIAALTDASAGALASWLNEQSEVSKILKDNTATLQTFSKAVSDKNIFARESSLQTINSELLKQKQRLQELREEREKLLKLEDTAEESYKKRRGLGGVDSNEITQLNADIAKLETTTQTMEKVIDDFGTGNEELIQTYGELNRVVEQSGTEFDKVAATVLRTTNDYRVMTKALEDADKQIKSGNLSAEQLQKILEDFGVQDTEGFDKLKDGVDAVSEATEAASSQIVRNNKKTLAWSSSNEVAVSILKDQLKVNTHLLTGLENYAKATGQATKDVKGYNAALATNLDLQAKLNAAEAAAAMSKAATISASRATQLEATAVSSSQLEVALAQESLNLAKENYATLVQKGQKEEAINEARVNIKRAELELDKALRASSLARLDLAIETAEADAELNRTSQLDIITNQVRMERQKLAVMKSQNEVSEDIARQENLIKGLLVSQREERLSLLEESKTLRDSAVDVSADRDLLQQSERYDKLIANQEDYIKSLKEEGAETKEIRKAELALQELRNSKRDALIDEADETASLMEQQLDMTERVTRAEEIQYTRSLILQKQRALAAIATELDETERIKRLQEIQALEQNLISLQRGSQQADFARALSITGAQDISTRNEEEDMDLAASTAADSLSQITSQVDGLGDLTSGIMTLTAAMVNLGDASVSSLALASAGLNTFASAMAMSSQVAIDEIDHQIAMEQARDGQSEESLQKIKELEAKKIKEQQKAAQKQILISTAVGVANALATGGPFPLNLVSAGLVAAAGAMAYAQASNAASNQLAQLNASDTTSTATTLELGERDNTIDVSQSANMGEYAYVTGQSGTGSAQSFTPRSNGGIGTPGNSIVTGENGAEVITPLEPVRVYNASQLSKQESGGSMNVTIQTLDTTDFESFIMRNAGATERAVRHEYEQQGLSIERLR